jgi:hypothetical protein
MTHLTETQFIDVLETGVPVDSRLASHLAVCEACQAALAELTGGLADARAVTLPEPSPLFWDHFSRRVRAATSQETAAGQAGWRHLWQPLVGATLAVATLALLVVFRATPGTPLTHEPATPSGSIIAAVTPASGTPVAAEVDDAGLNVVAVLAQDLRAEDLQQIAQPTTDATAAAIEDLTPAQCAEFIRLLKAQMSGAE